MHFFPLHGTCMTGHVLCDTGMVDVPRALVMGTEHNVRMSQYYNSGSVIKHFIILHYILHVN